MQPPRQPAPGHHRGGRRSLAPVGPGTSTSFKFKVPPTPWAEPGLWACRRASPGARCSWGPEPDPAASSAGRAVPPPGWDFQNSPTPALEAKLEPAAVPALCSCVGTPLAMRACVRAWDPRLACLALSLGGQLRAGASCLLRARSRQGAGLTPLSGEQFKNCWKASTEGEKKVSVKTCLAKRASLAEGLWLGSSPLCHGPYPRPGGQAQAGSRAELAAGRAEGSALEAVQLPAGERGVGDPQASLALPQVASVF